MMNFLPKERKILDVVDLKFLPKKTEFDESSVVAQCDVSVDGDGCLWLCVVQKWCPVWFCFLE